MLRRYMAVSGLMWSISFTIGPYCAGLILDSANSGLLWAFWGLVGMLTMLGLVILNKIRQPSAPVIEPAAAD